MSPLTAVDYEVRDITHDANARQDAIDAVVSTIFPDLLGADFDPLESSACSVVYAAFAQEVLIGVVGCSVPENSGHLDVERLAVLPVYRRKGVGEKLLATAEDLGRSIGRNALLLCSTRRAEQFYKNRGFRQRSPDCPLELIRYFD